MYRALTVVAGLLLASGALAQSEKGTVCLGPNLAKVLDEHSRRLYVRIDDSAKLYFAEPYRGPRLAVEGLDLDKSHRVRIYLDKRIVESWTFSFRRLNASGALVWRSAGAWRTAAIDPAECTR